MATLKDRIQQIIRDQVQTQQGGTRYQVGTVTTVNPDGTVNINVNGVSYVAGALYPLVQGQQCIAVFGDGGKISAVPTGAQPAATEVIHPPFFSGAAFMRFAIFNFSGTTPVPGPPVDTSQFLLEDSRSQNVFVANCGLGGLGFILTVGQFSPNGRFLGIIGVDNFVANFLIRVLDLGANPFSTASPRGSNVFNLSPTVILAFSVPLINGSILGQNQDIWVDDSGTPFWTKTDFFPDSSKTYSFYTYDSNIPGPKVLGTFSEGPFSTHFLFGIWDGPKGIVRGSTGFGTGVDFLYNMITNSYVLQEPVGGGGSFSNVLRTEIYVSTSFVAPDSSLNLWLKKTTGSSPPILTNAAIPGGTLAGNIYTPSPALAITTVRSVTLVQVSDLSFSPIGFRVLLLKGAPGSLVAGTEYVKISPKAVDEKLLAMSPYVTSSQINQFSYIDVAA